MQVRPRAQGRKAIILGPKEGSPQLGQCPAHLSPMQLGWVPLHVPSDWQNLRGEPTSTRGGWQEKETDDR